MTVVPFRPKHLQALQLQPAQAWMRPLLNDEYAATMAACLSGTFIDRSGVVAIIGVATIWPGRAHVSALLSGVGLLALHRFATRWLDETQIRRLEATVDGDFEAGHRWLRLLGFRLETPEGMPGYRPDGGLSFLYARVR